MKFCYILMTDIQSNNKRIARNTLLLYVRMLLTMAVSLYTSRVILNTLGVEDYGVYNVTGGVITMFAFLNTSMSSSTQRYITFALGRGDKKRLNVVFNTSIQIHILISILVFVLGETIGLWFVLNKLVIPEGREVAAMWVYQCSILSSIVGIMSVPYNADIIANERMSAFAYISILDVILKLIIVFILVVTPVDKLIFYSILVVCVQIFIRYVYAKYCSIHFEEVKILKMIDKRLLKEMSTFAGWSFFGNFACVLYGQGVNILLNVFFGPVTNAARGIAVQVQGAVQQFAGNFQMAINPQITKSYASGNIQQMHNLMFRSSRFSFYLLYFFILPVLLETSYVLTLWLKIVPDNTVIFTRIMLLIVLLNPFSSPLTIANQATGRIKLYQIIVGITLMSILPISYIVLKLGAPSYSVFIVHFVIELIAVFLRVIMLKKLISLSIIEYVKSVYGYVVIVLCLSPILPYFVRTFISEGFQRLVIVSFTSAISVMLIGYIFGLTKGERFMINSKISSIIMRIKNDSN